MKISAPKTRLSSSLTVFSKIIFLLFFVVSVVAGLFEADWKHNNIELIILILAFVMSFLVFYVLFGRAKNVYYDDQYLYVDNVFKRISIPLGNIESVKEEMFFSPHIGYIYLKDKTIFGQDIIFLCRTKFFLFFSPDPDIVKFKKIIKEVRSGELH